MNKKENTRTQENLYVITMLSRKPRQSVDFNVGLDKISGRMQETVDSGPEAENYCTEGYAQGINADLRHFIPLLRRRSRCFTRRIESLTAVMALFVEAYNRFGFAKFKYRQTYPTPMIYIGCVADDFTGASDAASYLQKGGLKTLLISGVPQEGFQLPPDMQAVVIALKTRTQETPLAVHDSLEALRWLKANGTKQFYLKYCSTFDSTPQGNIGPIADAALDFLDARYTLLCPSLPDNGRTVREGVLYVNGVPLEKTHMSRHPLTPMWDSRIAELMRRQSLYPVIAVNRQAMASQELTRPLLSAHERFYLVPDYETQADAKEICRLFGHLPLLTGGSGLLEALASMHGQGSPAPSIREEKGAGRTLILVGSCSVATQTQVADYLVHGGQGISVHPSQPGALLWQEARNLACENLMFYSHGSLGDASAPHDAKAATMLEETMAYLALQAVENGFTQIIVAGGETSGAVTRALGYQSFLVGQSVAPGVPILTPLEKPMMRLVLKSGNFGDTAFFAQAISMIREGGNHV